ncbi:hypothetical protein BpHYR1_009200, partial [Brachionus plicatilis]
IIQKLYFFLIELKLEFLGFIKVLKLGLTKIFEAINKLQSFCRAWNSVTQNLYNIKTCKLFQNTICASRFLEADENLASKSKMSNNFPLKTIQLEIQCVNLMVESGHTHYFTLLKVIYFPTPPQFIEHVDYFNKTKCAKNKQINWYLWLYWTVHQILNANINPRNLKR